MRTRLESLLMLVLAALSLALAPAAAAPAAGPNPPQPDGCYEIVSPFRGNAGLVLLNRCTGATWMLTMDPVLGADGRPNRSQTFAWHAIEMSKDPPVLFEPALPALPKLPQPAAPN